MINALTPQQIFAEHKFIPVVVLDDVHKAILLAKALLKGGINIMEITLRSKNAFTIIETIANDIPEMLIGAGTILNSDQYHKSIKHGAKFTVSPGLTPDLIDVAKDYDISFIPGAITPTEIMYAINADFNYLKFFPAESYNGLSILKALTSVFSQIKFCPTGGISLENAKQYLNIPNVAGVGCSFLADKFLIENSKFDEITQLAAKTINLLHHE
ncbi:MAG TPA: bifunctional 4-hydroxy-2-oxoglutarate aldolase/2-dehydro-3-deoxy-phosphogluconate aldolase [Burkholderiales bacterium]|nr:bifunctional 4-hydroxy-2-oxoglutarate aldolase/2-dehydro-3-deoxy-phosphogluconate aldolase [Burkholderiales bacterium]